MIMNPYRHILMHQEKTKRKNKMKQVRVIQMLLLVLLTSIYTTSFSQNSKTGELAISLNEDGSLYFKFALTSQVWMRYLESNPGSTLFGYEKKNGMDIGIRRTRIQAYGMVQKRTFLYTQFGINNFGFNSGRKPPIFFMISLPNIIFTKEVFTWELALVAGVDLHDSVRLL